MNRTATFVPIVGALVKAEDILGANLTWQAVNDQQRQFVRNYFSQRAQLNRFSPQELRSWVDTMASLLNEVLEREGFTDRLDQFDDDEFGVVSVLDVLVKWLTEGEATIIKTESMGSYPGVRLANRSGASNFVVGESSHHPHPVAKIDTQSGDHLYITVADKPAADFDLLRRVHMIESSMLSLPDYTSLAFPMINLDETVDITWLKGLKTMGESGLWKLSQALQQTKFKMNESGAHVKSMVAIGVMRGIDPSPSFHLVIDKPFFLWIKRPGASIPLFAAHLDEAVWKNPGNLDL
jgi:hypothetical protein